jgi:hypothetical protein
MSKEVQPKKTRSTKKVKEGSNTADLEAKIAELEAKLANLSSQVTQSEARPAKTSASPPKPQPRPAASGPTHGTLPAGFKPVEAPKPEPQPEPTTGAQPTGEVAPAYAKISSTGYTGNKYFATRKRLSYHPADKQFTGSSTTSSVSTTTLEPPKPRSTFRSTLPAGFKT